MKTITRKKYLQKIIVFTLFIMHGFTTVMIGCPTCIGYPDDNKPPFFEEQETKTNNDESNDNQSEHITTSITNDSQEDNS